MDDLNAQTRPSLLILKLGLRWAALVALTFWLGGFTFYSAVVIPILHDEMGGLESGRITGMVSNHLNAFGVAAIVIWWVLAWCERGPEERAVRRVRVGLLGVTTAVLALLIALHPIMDARLDSASMRSFHTLHFVYLNASTLQWGVNLALLAASVWIWRERRAAAD